MKILIDTCILVYLIDSSDEIKHQKVVDWFSSIIGDDDYFVSIQNLREFVFVAKKKNLIESGDIRHYINLFVDSFNLIEDNVTDILDASLSGSKRFFDNLLVSTAKRNGIFEILTENEKDFPLMKTLNLFKIH
jgi:predicted nucleic acid-binding protein